MEAEIRGNDGGERPLQTYDGYGERGPGKENVYDLLQLVWIHYLYNLVRKCGQDALLPNRQHVPPVRLCGCSSKIEAQQDGQRREI